MWQRTFDGVFDTRFEGHATHAAIGASACEFHQNTVVFGDVDELNIAAIGLQMRPDGFDGVEDFLFYFFVHFFLVAGCWPLASGS
jgi:hypothetical protein